MNRVILVIMVGSLMLANIVNAQIFLDSGSHKQMVMTNLSSMPLAFTENQGQFGEKTLFKANAGGAAFYFCGNEVTYLFVRDTDELIKDSRSGSEEIRNPSMQDVPNKSARSRYRKEALSIRAQFIGANPDVEVIGIGRLPHNSNYFLGKDPEKWSTDVPNYSAIIYRDIYPGIDLKYYGDGISLKYDFVVYPGADFSQVKIRYDGVEDLKISPIGALIIKTPFGYIQEKPPCIYQEIEGVRHEINGCYVISEPNVFGFVLESEYDPSRPLVIDPELVYSTYLGGLDWDESNGIAVGPDGSIYITGNTQSQDFPLANPIDSVLHPFEDYDVFVTRFSPDGSSLLFSTFIGESDYEIGHDITVDTEGNAYITGKTGSTDFPITANAYDCSHNGQTDVFVISISSTGDSLLYSTFLGGAGREQGRVIALDMAGDIYITGYTNSTDFPTVNSYDGSHNGGNDAFVAKLSASGESLSYSTYLGGANPDYPYGMVVDVDGNVYIAGGTGSIDFPMVNPYNGTNNGLYDVFVAKLAATGDSLLYCTYLGGDDDDVGWGVALNGDGEIYFAGGTSSSDFPMVNPIDGNFNGYYDAFVAKFSALGDSLIYSTYLGGTMYDEVWGMVIDDLGNAYITGGTSSSNFPTTDDAFDQGHNGSYDVFMAKISDSGDSLLYSTYIGGYDPDYGFDIAIDNERCVYITGRSRTPDFPTVNPYDATHNGYYDAIVVKFMPSSEPIPTLSEWGMIVLALLILAIGTVAVIRRRRVVTIEGRQ